MNEKSCIEVFRRYPKAVVHLRQQIAVERFGLVLGSGASSDFKVPKWGELVAKLAADPAINGEDLINGGLAKDTSYPYKTELLLERHKKNHSVDATLTRRQQENTITSNWLGLCQKYLYENEPDDFALAVASHPYFRPLISLIKQTYLTINFNFDDYVERGLALTREGDDLQTRGYECVTNPWPQFKRKNCVIYHPHGVVPKASLMELPVDRFVFSETGYAKQYIGEGKQDTLFLLTHLARHTCLMVGCSREDAFRSILINGSSINPGNYHYYVHYLDDSSRPSETEMQAIYDTNFDVYNIITLFLRSDEIACFLELINLQNFPDNRFIAMAEESGITCHFNFYMTGALGVGKSTAASQLRSLFVLDEWLDQRPDVLGLDWRDLSPEQRIEADTWIVDQFKKKNRTLRDAMSHRGVLALVDRPPLDPLLFTPLNEWPQKAKMLLDALCPNGAGFVAPGVVILLLGYCEELSARVRTSGRNEYTAEKLDAMQELAKTLYDTKDVVILDTRDKTISDVARQVARIVHGPDYSPFDLTGSLKVEAAKSQEKTNV